MLPIRKAWRVLAEAFEKPDDCCFFGNLNGLPLVGLCHGIRTLRDDLRVINVATAQRMRQRIKEYREPTYQNNIYVWPIQTADGCKARAAFCRRLANGHGVTK